MTEEQIVGFIILIIGWLQAMRPDLMLRFQTWTQRKIMGAKYEPTARTHVFVRIIGIIFVVLGLMITVGLIQ